MMNKIRDNSMNAQSASFLFVGVRFAGLYYRAYFGGEKTLSEDLR